jgi:hypothetical protein
MRGVVGDANYYESVDGGLKVPVAALGERYLPG